MIYLTTTDICGRNTVPSTVPKNSTENTGKNIQITLGSARDILWQNCYRCCTVAGQCPLAKKIVAQGFRLIVLFC